MIDHWYILKYMAELKMHEKKSKDQLLEIQLKKLKRMINHVYDNVPYYRELFINNNITPDDIKKLEDLEKIPITKKRDIQANYDKIIAKGSNLEQCKLVNTTGSTGIPLRTYGDKNSLCYSSALVYYAFFESGMRLRDRTVELTGIPEKEAHILRKDLVSTQETPEKIIQLLKKYNPDVLYSFPSVFKIISPYIENNKDKRGLNPRMIFTHGETLTESCRDTIESAFGAKVYNTYGATEFYRLAFECDQHSGLHMLTDCAVMELVKDGQSVGPGEEGDIVVTGLYNYTMPLIRYNLGDIGIFSDEDDTCPCGRGWPLIKSIEGRVDDFLTLPSGRIISPRAINVIENIPGIVQYRTVQTKRDTFFVQVVPGKDFSPDTERQIGEQIRLGCLGEDIKINVELVNELPRERTGKLRTIISQVK